MSNVIKMLPAVPGLKVRMMATGSLVPYANNARHHPESEIKALMRSIKEHGVVTTIGIDNDTNRNVLYGHARLEAAIRRGIPEVPVAILSHLNPAHLRAYTLAAHPIAKKAGWSKKPRAA